MKFLHISDLHLGKRVNEFSMLEDQKHILRQISGIIDSEKPDAVLIAGDIYDKSVPPVEAVELFDSFIVELSGKDLQTFIISGNHDSPERLAFGSRLIDDSGIHISPVYSGKLSPFTMEDGFGKLNVYMLPFIKPAHVRRYFPEEEINSYTDAVRVALSGIDFKGEERSVLVTHQFVTGALRSESEEISVGGSDNVDSSVFEKFDYTALGHIHGPQNIGSEKIRYSGTPLKYSFSEACHEKSVTIAELCEKGSLSVRTVPLTPLHDMKEIKGSYEEVTNKSFYEGTSLCEDYLHITLTDEEDIPDVSGKLRTIYHNLMRIDYDNSRTRRHADITGAERVEERSPIELFEEFYQLQNGLPLSDKQKALMTDLIENIWEETT